MPLANTIFIAAIFDHNRDKNCQDFVKISLDLTQIFFRSRVRSNIFVSVQEFFIT